MKKLPLLILTGLSVWGLTACANFPSSTANKTESQATTQQETTPLTRTFKFEQEIFGLNQEITESLTYRGEEFLTVDFKLLSSFDQETKDDLKELGFEEAKNTLLQGIDADPIFTNLQSIPGVNFSTQVLENYDISVDFTIDAQTADWAEVQKATEDIIDLPDLDETTPEDYIQNLLDNGATEITN